MEKRALSRAEYAIGETARDLSICTDILQAAANYVFSLPELDQGTYFIQTEQDHPFQRVIVAHPATLAIDRPYMVGFYGWRSPDPAGSLTGQLLAVDNRLIDSLADYGVGFYDTAYWQGEYINTAIFRDKEACTRWGSENDLHQAAVEHLAPKCYRKILKFTGYVAGWAKACEIELDEVLLLNA